MIDFMPEDLHLMVLTRADPHGGRIFFHFGGIFLITSLI
jgi:drug/metabolite transporter superfamily protein YnfA